MGRRISWEDYKRSRPMTPEVRRGYEEARAEFELAERVRHMRERCGLTQTELARRMGVTQPTIARLEAGGTTPNIGTLRRIAEALGLELVIDFREATAAGR